MKRYEIVCGSYYGVSKEEWDKFKDYHPNFAEDIPKDDEVTRLSRIVFAPGQDGNPTSDIGYYLSCGDDGFKEYMKNTLLKERPGDVGSDDPDVVEATLKKNLWTYQEYFDAMDSYIHSQYQDKSE